MSKIKTIQQLIEMKDAISKKRNEVKEFEVKSLGTVFKYKMATRAEMMALKDMEDADVDSYNVFSHVVEPDLKDKTLQSAYNQGQNPFKVVDSLLSPSEVIDLSLAIVGKNKNDLTKAVKN